MCESCDRGAPAGKFAKKYFAEKYIVMEENSDLVWWKCIEKASLDWATMYRVWLTKQGAACCGANKRLSYWDNKVTLQCSVCKEENNSVHITRCRHPTRRKLLKQTAREISL